MRINDIEDIDKRRRQKESRELAGLFTNTFEHIEDYFKRRDIQQSIKNKKNPKWYFRKFLGVLGLLGLLILCLNFVLGNLWLLKALIKSLFKIG